MLGRSAIAPNRNSRSLILCRGYPDDRNYGAHPLQARGNEPYFEDGAPMAPHDDETYDDPPRANKRGGLLTAVTLIGCAMIGTAGAYGYRTYYVAPGGSKTPPIITADTTPSKVVSAGETQPAKVIQDRVGELGERVVSREEQPVEIRSPRVVLPAPVAPQGMGGVTAPPGPSSASPGSAAPTAGGNEPKRVRTVTIRPDGTDLGGKPVGGMSDNAQGAGARTSGSAARQSPVLPKSAQPARNGGPISLDPQNSAAEESAPPVRERVASTPPATQTTPPAPRLAGTSTNTSSGGSGGYVVQLSSQRSESEAQSSYRALQAKYSSLLGGYQPLIRRAELGDKGVFYRAMVGPFGSSEEASRFCASLKAAGGQCLIQRN